MPRWTVNPVSFSNLCTLFHIRNPFSRRPTARLPIDLVNTVNKFEQVWESQVNKFEQLHVAGSMCGWGVPSEQVHVWSYRDSVDRQNDRQTELKRFPPANYVCGR